MFGGHQWSSHAHDHHAKCGCWTFCTLRQPQPPPHEVCYHPQEGHLEHHLCCGGCGWCTLCVVLMGVAAPLVSPEHTPLIVAVGHSCLSSARGKPSQLPTAAEQCPMQCQSPAPPGPSTPPPTSSRCAAAPSTPRPEPGLPQPPHQER